MSGLRTDDRGKPIQAFVLEKGHTTLTGGTVAFPLAIHCVAAGTITITWKDDSTTQVALVENDDFSFDDNVKSVTIDAAGGTFHVMTGRL